MIVTAGAVRRAAQTTLTTWFPSCLAEVCRDEGKTLICDDQARTDRDLIEQPRSWLRLAQPEDATPDQLPAVGVTCDGTSDVEQQEDGLYAANFEVIVAIWARGLDYDDVADLLPIYAGAAALALARHGDLGGLASWTVFTGWAFGELVDSRSSRTLGGAFVTFDVKAEGVIDVFAGPSTPPDDPCAAPPDDPTADTVTVIEHPLD